MTDRETTGAPLWAKIFGVIALIVLVIFIVAFVSGRRHDGGGHGPGRHNMGAPAEVSAAQR